MRSHRPRTETQVDRLVLSLREKLLHGDFRPGQRLTELGMVPLLGASRTPVRLALERLAHEGLLDPIQTGGFRVRSFHVADILDSIEVRAVLEGTAARLAAERLKSAAELSTLRSLQREARLDVPVTVEGFGRFLAFNDQFHAELWRLSKSPALVRAIELACRVPFAAPSALVYIHAERDPGDVYVAAEQHRALVEAIEAREGTRGEALAREHSRVGVRTLLMALERRDGLTDVPGAALIVA